MEQFIHYFSASWISIKRAPLPYALTILIMGLGLGVFFSNVTFYYWINHDPLPHKSDKLFFPRIASQPFDCNGCNPPNVLSYADVRKLNSSGIPSASAAMYSASGYVKDDENNPVMAATIRFTQRDFFRLFDVPIKNGQIWPDNNARMEAILSSDFAEKLFGSTDVVGRNFFLDEKNFMVIAVLNKWSMWPKLYDVNNGSYREPVEDIYLPLEVGYDLSFRTNSQSNGFEPINPAKMATEGREKSYHFLQFWVQLDSLEQQKKYRMFMHNLVLDEKLAGRHPSADTSRLDAMKNIMAAFRIEESEIKAFSLVTLLFLFVCVFNASHLTLNRHMANQYEFTLRRALGASSRHLRRQLMVDVLLSSFFSLIFASLIAWAGIYLMTSLLPNIQHLARWNFSVFFWLVSLNLAVNYVISFYPAIRTSFGNISLQLKS